MATRLYTLLFLVLAAAAPLWAQATPDEVKGIQFPNNPVNDVANFYEQLTGKRLLRDAQVVQGGTTISLVVNQPVTKAEAAALIESVLALNGYTLVDVDKKTMKLLSPAKPARSESVLLYTDPSQLPSGDEIVSYFMPFRYLKVEDATNAFTQYAPPHPFGGYVPVPSANAMLITETAALIRRLIAMKNVIDIPGARMDTQFFVLERADAEKVVEVLSKMFEKSDDAPTARVGGSPNGQPPGAAPAAGTALAGPAQKVQVFADKRTNRVIVTAPEGQMASIRSIVEQLDSAVSFEQPLERPLRFVKAGDVLPVLASLLADKDDKNGAPNIVGGQDSGGNGAASQGSSNSNYSGDNSSSSGSGGPSVSTNTTFTIEDTKPQAVVVGNARLIADRSVNKIIVIGPPEAKLKASQVLDMLDQRPKQVYLAVVIGQLTLGNNLDVGINYLIKTSGPNGKLRALGTGTTGDIQNLLNSRSGSIDLVPDTNTAANAAATAATTAASAIPVLSGLTVFGSIADSVDILARAMAATNKFKVISRPVVYTSNGQAAKISSGQSVPVATGTLTSAVDTSTNNGNGASIASNVQYKDIVLELEVQPLINSDHEVTLKIKQKNDTIEGTTTVSGNPYPTLGVQGLNTVITVPNRNTVVLGGLISEQDERNQTGIPLLKDLPYVGYLFGSITKVKTRRELIIMIQPFIVDTDEKLAEVNYIERSNTGFKEGLFDQPVPVKKATLPAATDVVPQIVR